MPPVLINKGVPTLGSVAIADAIAVFFAEFPDLLLLMDDLRTGGCQAVYLWNLEGTDSQTG